VVPPGELVEGQNYERVCLKSSSSTPCVYGMAPAPHRRRSGCPTAAGREPT